MGLQHTFKHGEPVWVRMEEFPWWPARIVTRDEIQLDPGEVFPRQKPDELLVEFFNDEKRFAPISKKDLRPFIEHRYRTLNNDYQGEYLETVITAISEAERYMSEWLGNGVPKVEAKGGEGTNGRGRGGKRRRGRARLEAGDKRKKAIDGNKASTDVMAGEDSVATRAENAHHAADLLINDRPTLAGATSATATVPPTHHVTALPLGSMQMTTAMPLQPVTTTSGLQTQAPTVALHGPPANADLHTAALTLGLQASPATGGIQTPVASGGAHSHANAENGQAAAGTTGRMQTTAITGGNVHTPVASDRIEATVVPSMQNAMAGAPQMESRMVGNGAISMGGNGFVVDGGSVMEHVPTEGVDVQSKTDQGGDSPNYGVLSHAEMITLLTMKDETIRQLNTRVTELEMEGKGGHEKITRGIRLIRDGQSQILEEGKVKAGRNTG